VGAIVDPLLHNAVVLNIGGQTYGMRANQEALTEQRTGTQPEQCQVSEASPSRFDPVTLIVPLAALEKGCVAPSQAER
jgi:hypothetical protein